jgi:dTMP kinase
MALDNLVSYSQNNEGAIIVIDGGDGSGKTRQTALLMDELNRIKENSGLSLEVGTLDFPQYGKNVFADFTGRYLNGEFGDSSKMNPYFIIPYFALDRFSEKKNLLKFREKGSIGILNRYTTSNLGHQAAKFSDANKAWECASFIERMEYDVLGLPRPNLVFYLDVPWEIGKLLIMAKKERAYTNGKILDGHESSADYQDKAAFFFRELCKTRAAKKSGHESWIRIDCSRHDDGASGKVKELEDFLISDFTEESKAKVKDEISKTLLLSPEEIHEKIDEKIEEFFQV